jgi:hypothetical protein
MLLAGAVFRKRSTTFAPARVGQLLKGRQIQNGVGCDTRSHTDGIRKATPNGH